MQKIQIKSGTKKDLLSLDVGEFGLCTDTNELFIGSQNGNILIANNSDIGFLEGLLTNDKSNLVNAINDHIINDSIYKLNDLTDVDTMASIPKEGDILTFKNSVWQADSYLSRSKGVYLIELARWSINNDGTNPVSTTIGINQALQWASDQNYMEVVFPYGTYLIDENQSIEPRSFQTLNLNGATLKINPNKLQGYSIVSFYRNQKYSRITNGKIEGDKTIHDYSSGGTHEGGFGIQVGSFVPPTEGGNNTRFISIDNLEISNCTGDSISINSTFGQISPPPQSLADSWEIGSFHFENGSLISVNNKIRSKLKINMNQTLIQKYGYFGLYGNGYGDLGTGITCDFYDVFFYNSDDTFISVSIKVRFFDEVEIPKEAEYAKVTLYQDTLPNKNNCLINIRVPSFPQHTYIHKCDLHNSRRLGISVSGSKHVYIADNQIHDIKGTAPQGGIDIEDGYDLNQFIHITKNNFYNNYSYNIIVVNGKNIFIQDNKLPQTVNNGVSLTINPGADNVLVENNSLTHTKAILSGNVIFTSNYIYGTQVNIQGVYKNKPINLHNSSFQNCKLVVDNPFPYIVRIDGCVFHNDLEKLNAFSNLQWSLELKNNPQVFSNCRFEGKDVYYNLYTTSSFKGGWLFENTIFKTSTTLVGKYVNCTFTEDITTLGVKGSDIDTIELLQCRIMSSDRNNTLISLDKIKSFRMLNCYIEKPNGHILKIKNVNEEILIMGNTIKITDDTLIRNIIEIDSAFSGQSIVMKDNLIKSTNLKQVGIKNSSINNPQTVICNNILQKAIIESENKGIQYNNIIDNVLF